MKNWHNLSIKIELANETHNAARWAATGAWATNNDNLVTRTLSRLHNEGAIVRVATGIYLNPKNTQPAQHKKTKIKSL